MFKEIRRKEKRLTGEECNEILTNAEYGTLATMGIDDYPYAVPLNYVYHNGSIYFRFFSNLVGEEGPRIPGSKDSRVCFLM